MTEKKKRDMMEGGSKGDGAGGKGSET